MRIYKRVICVTRTHTGTKTMFSLTHGVWCVRVGHPSCAQCTKNVHPLVLSVPFFSFFENRRPHAVAPVSEEQKKACPYDVAFVRSNSSTAASNRSIFSPFSCLCCFVYTVRNNATFCMSKSKQDKNA